MLSFTDARKEAHSAKRYSGGVQMHLAGPRGAHTLTILLWHDVEHITQSGDVAPGLGPHQR